MRARCPRRSATSSWRGLSDHVRHYGIIDLTGAPVDASLLEAMGGVTRHRGPDDLGAHVDGACAIGMTRLSIIDLAGGHQPIANEDETAWLVCNGEIYNFRELRRELEAAGHRFRTHSDSEVLLHGYEQWGDAVVERMNGMFGFALWDARRRRLLVGRDRLGIKPIYVHSDGRRLVFATEAKAILTLPVSPAAWTRWRCIPICNWASFRRRTPCSRHPQAPVATLLAVEVTGHGALLLGAFPIAPITAASEADWVERVREGIARSVKMQMGSDVPSVLPLRRPRLQRRGGLHGQGHGPSGKTYAIGFEGGPAEALYNELPYARRVAELFGTEHHEIVVKPDVVGLLPRLLWHMDEPIADSAFLTTYLVSEFAHRDVTVILSGVGGDELFGGYRRYLGNHYAERFERLPGWLKQGARAVGRVLPSDRHSAALNVMRLAKGFLASSALSFEERYRAYLQLMPAQLARHLLHVTPAQPWDAIHAAFASAGGEDALNRMLVVDGLTQLPDDLLMLTDKMSMADVAGMPRAAPGPRAGGNWPPPCRSTSRCAAGASSTS